MNEFIVTLFLTQYTNLMVLNLKIQTKMSSKNTKKKIQNENFQT